MATLDVAQRAQTIRRAAAIDPSADPANDELVAFMDELLVEVGTIGPAEQLCEESIRVLRSWLAVDGTDDAVLVRRWEEAARAAVATFALDPLGARASRNAKFVAEVVAHFSVRKTDVPSLIYAVQRATARDREQLVESWRTRASVQRGETSEEGSAIPAHRQLPYITQRLVGEQGTSPSSSVAAVIARIPFSGRRESVSKAVGGPAQRGGDCRDIASTKLRTTLLRFLATDPNARTTLIDGGTDRLRMWPGLRSFDADALAGPPVGASSVPALAQALIELDESPRTFVLAAAAAFIAGRTDVADDIANRGLLLHGTRGHAAPLALTRARVARLADRWHEAREWYASATLCRIDRYRQSAIASGAFNSVDCDDAVSALVFCDRGLAEPFDSMAAAYGESLRLRQRRDGKESAETQLAALKTTLTDHGRDPRRYLGDLV